MTRASPRPLRGLRHLALKCRDVTAMERFYAGLLGYRVEWKPDSENVYLTNGEDSIALHLDTAAAQATETRLDHLGVMVEALEDVDDWAAHLAAHAVPFAAQPKTHRDGCRSFYVFDPEGNRVQVLWHPGVRLG